MADSPSTLLHAVYHVGEQMCEALQADDLDAFFSLVHERGTLLDNLQHSGPPDETDPCWRDTASALAAQKEELADALAGQEARMNETLRTLERFKQARSHYADPPHRNGVLNQSLRG